MRLLVLLLWASVALADQLVVTVRDASTQQPLAGAYAQVGPAPGAPFAGNFGFTDQEGRASFTHPSLTPGLPLTVAALGYARLTVLSCPTGALTVWLHPSLPPQWPDTSLITGVVRGLPIQQNDGFLDVGVVMGTVSAGEILGGSMASLFSPFVDTMHVGPPVNQDVEVPENVDIPSQQELLFVTFFKEPYTQRFRTGATVDMVCLGYRLSVWDLISGQPQSFAATKASARRDFSVTGDATVNFQCTVNFVHNIRVAVSNLPQAARGLAASVAKLSQCPRPQRFFPAHGVVIPPGVDTTVSISSLPATAPLADVVCYASAVYTDTSAQPTWGGGAVDWTPLVPNATRSFTHFFAPPTLARVGFTFSFQGYQTPGTPQADWALSRFALRDPTSQAPDTCVWEVVGPGAAQAFQVPVLHPTAPGWHVLPDPSQTPAPNILVWTCTLLAGGNLSLDSVLAASLEGVTLFTFRSVDATPLPPPAWVQISASGPGMLALAWAPVEGAEEYLVEWAPQAWGAPQGQAWTQAPAFTDPSPLPGASARFYRVRSKRGVVLSVPSAGVGGMTWLLSLPPPGLLSSGGDPPAGTPGAGGGSCRWWPPSPAPPGGRVGPASR